MIKNCNKTLRKNILKSCGRRFDVRLTSLSSQRVNDKKKCLNTENTIDDGMFFLSKEFCANGISLGVKTGISLLDEKHLVDKTIRFSLALF